MVLRRRSKMSRSVPGKRPGERRTRTFFVGAIVIGSVIMSGLLLQIVMDAEESEDGYFSRNKPFADHPSLEQDALSPRVARELARADQAAEENPVSLLNPAKFLPQTSRDPGSRASSQELDHWQSVVETKEKFFVFSAYYDDRKGRFIRVIAAARTRRAEKVQCKLWMQPESETPVTVQGFNKLIRENWNLKYSAYFLLCPLNKEATVPHSVSIVRDGSTLVSNRLFVHNNKDPSAHPLENMAVCVKPLHYSYNKVYNFVEFIELNRIFGVSHFVFYNDTVGANVDCLLEKYRERGVVTVLPWKLDMVSQKEIRTEGLFAALNDCLYRTMHRFKYVLMIDLDEYIVPHKDNSLTELVVRLSKKNLERTGAYSFQNCFFYLQWPNDSSSKDLPFPLVTLQKTVRRSKFHTHKQRSKCIVLPEHVVEMGNHFVWEFIPGKLMQNVPPDLAFLHHYRVCEFGGDDCIKTSSATDRTVYNWKESLIRRVEATVREAASSCPAFRNQTWLR